VHLGDLGEVDFGTICESCAFVPQIDTDDGLWEIAFNCSTLVEGPCVGRTPDGMCIVRNPNNLTEEVAVIQPSECLAAIAIEEFPFSESQNVFALPILGSSIDAFACNLVSTVRWTGWYTFLGGTGGCFKATTVGSEFDTIVGVYTGECGDLSCIGENDDIASIMSLQSEVEWFMESNTTYHLILQHYDIVPFGNYTLNISVRRTPRNSKLAVWKGVLYF
jgi:hypothetical protein